MIMANGNDDELARALLNRVQNDFEKMNAGTQAALNEKMEDVSNLIRNSRERIDQVMKDVEERVTRDVRTKVFGIALTIVVAAAGTMLVGSFAATRDVNNSVIALQKDIISAQTSIRESQSKLDEQAKHITDFLSEQTTKLTAAQNSMVTDLPLNFHPAAVRASANVTPFGAVSVPA